MRSKIKIFIQSLLFFNLFFAVMHSLNCYAAVNCTSVNYDPLETLSIGSSKSDVICSGYYQRYRFSITSGNEYKVILTPYSSHDPDLYLYHTSDVSNQLSSSASRKSGGIIDQVTFTASSSGFYYAAVHGLSGYSNGKVSYTIKVEETVSKPGTPSLYSPDNYDIKYNRTPHFFSWYSSSNASSYQILVDNDNGFGSTVINENVNSTSLNSYRNLSNNVYFWKVRARNSSNTYGDWSSTRRFVVDTPPPAPSLNSPSSGTSYIQGNSITFRWYSGSNIDRYYLRVVKGTNFNNSPVYDIETSSTSKSVSTSAWSTGSYTWGVRAIKNQPSGFNQWDYEHEIDWGEYTKRTITIKEPPPSTPSNFSLSKLPNGIRLTWNGSYGASKYKIHWGNDNSVNETNTATILQTTSTEFDHTSLSHGYTYYYKVKACNDAGCSSLSGLKYLKFEKTPSTPSGLYLSERSNGFKVSWSESSRSSYYQLYWGRNSSVNEGQVSPIYNTYYQHSGLTNGQTYYYKVKACNNAGCSSLSSYKYSKFEVEPPAPTGLSLSTISNGLKISWSSVSDATSYKIYWGNDNSVNDSNYSLIFDTSNTYRNHTPLCSGSTYYYRVKACNNAGCGNLSDMKFKDAPLADLSISFTSVPTNPNVQQGDTYEINCRISKSGGLLRPEDYFVRIYVYLNQNATSFSSQDLILGDSNSFDVTANLLDDGSQTCSKNVSIPSNKEGEYYLHLKVDGTEYWSNVESNKSNNTATMSKTLKIWRSGTPPSNELYGVLARSVDLSNIYWIKYNKKFWINDQQLFYDLGYSNNQVKWYGPGALGQFGEKNQIFRANGKFTYRSYNDSTVFVIKADGKSYPFYTEKEFEDAGFYDEDVYWANSTGYNFLKGDDDQNEILQGYLDNADCNNNIRGWTLSSSTTAPIKVRIYSDGPIGSGTLIDEVTANLLRPDLFTDNKNHGFVLEIPMSLKNGQEHVIYAYAVGSDNVTTKELNRSGEKSFSCEGWEVGVPPGDDGILAKTYNDARVYWIKYNRIWHILGDLDGENPFRKLGYYDYNIKTYGPNALNGYTEVNQIPSDNGTFCYKNINDNDFNVYLIKGSKSYKFLNKYSFYASGFKDFQIYFANDVGFQWLQNKYTVAGVEDKPFNIEIISSSPLRIDPTRVNPSISYALPDLSEFNGLPTELEKNFKASFKITNPESYKVTIDEWGIFVSEGKNTDFYLTNKTPITLNPGDESPKFDLRGFITDNQLTGAYSTTFHAKVVVKINGQWIDVNGGGNTAVFLVYRRPNIKNQFLVKAPDSSNLYFTQYGYKWKIENEIAASQLNSNWKQEYYVYPKTIINELSDPSHPIYNSSTPKIPGENLLFKNNTENDIYIIEPDANNHRIVSKKFEEEADFFNYGYRKGALTTQVITVDQFMFDWLTDQFEISQTTIEKEKEYIQIISPKTGSKWDKNKRYIISWDTNIEGNLCIELYPENQFGLPKTIECANACKDKILWTVEKDVLADVNYSLRLISSSNSAISSTVQLLFNNNDPPVISLVDKKVFLNSDWAYFSWECSDPDNDAIHGYEYEIDNQGYSVNDSEITLNNLDNGYHNFRVRCMDTHGIPSDWEYYNFFVNYKLIEKGITVITHGWKVGKEGETPPKWAVKMGLAILERLVTGHLFIHDPETGEWLNIKDNKFSEYEIEDDLKNWKESNNPEDEIVLIYNWVWESDDGLFEPIHKGKGWLISAAHSLFASLLSPPKIQGEEVNLFEKPIHFIGHSRGAVLNLETVKLIGYYFKNKQIDHFTSLDPHPWSTPRDPGYNIDEPLESSIHISENINFADNYYRQDGNFIINKVYEKNGDFNGVPAIGASFSRLLNEKVLESKGSGYELILGGQEHADVHLWYHGTIDTSFSAYDSNHKVPSFWYQTENMGPRDKIGYFYSRIGGGRQTISSSDHETRKVITKPEEIIVNGDFSFVAGNDKKQLPGWERHGGGGDGSVENGHLVLNDENLIRTHNPFYIPKDKMYISFIYKYEVNEDELPSNISIDQADKLYVNLIVRNSTVIEEKILLNRINKYFVTIILNISKYSGSVAKVKFRFQKGELDIDSCVWVDDVEVYDNQRINDILLHSDESLFFENIGKKGFETLYDDPVRQKFVSTYLNEKGKLGCPFNNGSRYYVHQWNEKWDNFWIQDFKGEVYGESALILSTNKQNKEEVFIVKEKFWEYYKQFVNPPSVFGKPVSNEFISEITGKLIQDFEKGRMYSYPQDIVFIPKNSDPQNLSLADFDLVYKEGIEKVRYQCIVVNSYARKRTIQWIDIGIDDTPQDDFEWISGLSEAKIKIRAQIFDGQTWSDEWYTSNQIRYIDNLPPVTTDNTADIWHTEPFSISLTVFDGNDIDSNTGVNTFYSIDNTTPDQPGTLISISESGIYTIQYYSVDASRNAETIKTASFLAKLDQEGPIFRSIKTEPQDLCDSYGNDYIITSDIIDSVSGIQDQIPQISYRFSTTDDSTLQAMTLIDNNTFMFSIPQPEEGWGILSDQILYYTITCKDVAGNTSYFKGSEYINPIDGPFLTVTPSYLELPSINGISVLTISNSGINDLDWTVLSNATWLTMISTTTGINNDYIVISYDHNDTEISRAATLTITSQSAENRSQIVELIQQGEDSHIIHIPEDQPTIQAGIDIADDGDVILVQPGIYTENIDFKGKSISVGSLFLVTGDTSYITQTIINGNQNGSVVSFTSEEDQQSVLNGFTLTNGSGSNQYSSTGFDGGAIICKQSGPVLTNLIIDYNESDYGSGISCIQNANPILANVHMKNNHARKYGGGLFISDDSQPIIAKSMIFNNTANESGAGIYCANSVVLWLKNSEVHNNSAVIKGGGIYLDHSTGLFSHLTIANNQVNGEDGTGGGLYLVQKSDASFFNVNIANNTAVNKGAGVYCETSDPIITDSSITNNSAGRGGGFYCTSFSNPVLTGVDITNNSAISEINGDGGGVICLNSAPVFNNVLIVRNVSNGFGAGIQASNNANPIINNATIANNTSTNGGAIFCGNNSHVTLNNTIVWNNSPQNIYFADWNIENSISINYSDIQDGVEGIKTNDNGTVQWNNGNLSIDPIFVNIDTNNYHLQSDSSCINAGEPDAVFAKEPIYNGNRINLGRYGNTHEATSTIPPFVLAASDQSVTLPTLKGSYTITVMNSGSGTMKWKATTDASWINLENDSGINDGNCAFQYQTNTDEERKATILITATEAENITYSIDITQSENNSPEISEINNQTINEDTFHQLFFDATDIETGLLNAYVLSSDTGLIPYQNISLANNGERYTLSILPKTDQSGACELTITIDDSYNSIFKSFSIFVSAINDAPEAKDYSFTVVENALQGTFVGSIEGEDVDENDVLSYSIVDGNIENAFDIHNETGAITVDNSNAINCESGVSYTLTIGIADGITTVYSTALVSINGIPVANSDSLTVTEDHSISSSLTATDINGDPLTFQIVVQPEKGDVTLTNSSSGDFIYVPYPNETNSDVFGFIVSDGNASSLTATISINILPVDDAPVINIPIDDISIDEDTLMDCLDLSSVFTDIDNNDESITHTIQSIGNPDLLTATIHGSALCLTLLENQNGLSTIEISGLSNGQSVTDVFEILVHPVNDPPSILPDSVSIIDHVANGCVIADQTINEDSSLTPISFTILDSETADSNLIVSSNSSNLMLISLSNLKIEGTGASRILSLTPTSNENGSTIITLSVTDGELTSTTSFSLTVNAINDTPIISSIVDQKIDEDTSLPQISFTVSDVESSDLILSGSSSNPTLINSTNINIEGSGVSRTISLTPTSNENGSTVISISVTDGELTSTTSFTLTVSEINDPPVISSVSNQTINEDTELSQISFTVSDLETSDLIVSANSSNPTLVNSISIEGTDENRILSLTPTSNENGIAIISLSATDGELTATTSFTLTVNAVNDRPVISSVSDQIIEEDSTLSQISFTVSDIETSDLIVSASSSNSTLITNMQIEGTGADRTLSLTPVSNENGVSIISLSVTDGDLTATTSFTLTVSAINDDPVISAISDQTIDEDTALSTVSFTVSDIETSDLIVTGTSSNPTLVNISTIKFDDTGASRTLTLTPCSNEFGNAIISVSVSDGKLIATTSFE
ncbi:hypothetical protein MHK_000442, partial [Candidatus Magnetomorum sp. HK-1]